MTTLEDSGQYDVLFYRFKHQYLKAEQVHKRLRKINRNFTFKLEMNRDSSGHVGHTVPDEQTAIEFATCMRHFLLPQSDLYFEKLLEVLKKFSNNVDYQEFLLSIKQEVNKAKKGPISLKENDKDIFASDIFIEFAKNILFANDVDAIEFQKKLMKNPVIGHLKWNTFYGYCMDIFNILSSVLNYLSLNNISPVAANVENYCIFCKTKQGKFTTYEHIVPEAIGNEILFLGKGYVCDKCNNRLSEIENQFVKTMPMSFLRIFSNTISKKGKLPEAKFENIHFKKTSMNSIKMISHGNKKNKLQPIKQPQGGYKFTLPQIKQKVDYHMIARVLYKIGLEIVVIDRGREFALHSKYDDARKYVLDGGTFPNMLIMDTDTTPDGRGEIHSMYDEKGTYFHFHLLGAKFVINIEPEPVMQIPEQMRELVIAFDLSKRFMG